MKTIRLPLTKSFRHYIMLLFITTFCFGMLMIRATITHSLFYFFLVWNLFLAAVPFAITTFMLNRSGVQQSRLLFYTAFISWLLFLPNAPYLITDFIHLGKNPGVPLWFDVLLLISFAITGLLLAVASMRSMHTMLIARFSSGFAAKAMIAACFLSGFGVYLGRVLRYNSWDVLHRPFELAGDILMSLVAADSYRTAWGITLGFGTLMYLLYMLSRNISFQKNL